MDLLLNYLWIIIFRIWDHLKNILKLCTSHMPNGWDSYEHELCTCEKKLLSFSNATVSECKRQEQEFYSCLQSGFDVFFALDEVRQSSFQRPCAFLILMVFLRNFLYFYVHICPKYFHRKCSTKQLDYNLQIYNIFYWKKKIQKPSHVYFIMPLHLDANFGNH